MDADTAIIDHLVDVTGTPVEKEAWHRVARKMKLCREGLEAVLTSEAEAAHLIATLYLNPK
jgi:hypothetical protein